MNPEQKTGESYGKPVEGNDDFVKLVKILTAIATQVKDQSVFQPRPLGPEAEAAIVAYANMRGALAQNPPAAQASAAQAPAAQAPAAQAPTAQAPATPAYK